MEVLIEELTRKMEYAFHNCKKDVTNTDIYNCDVILKNVSSIKMLEAGVIITLTDNGFERPVFIEKQDFLTIKIM